MNGLTNAVVLGLLLSGFVCDATFADEATRERFLKEAPPAWAAYARKLEFVEGESISYISDVGKDVPRDTASLSRFTFAKTEGVRIDSQSRAGVLDDWKESGAIARNQRYAFTLDRPEAEWTISDLDMQPQLSAPSTSSGLFQNSADRNRWGLSIFRAHLPEMLREPSFKLLDAQPVDELVRITFQYDPADPLNNPVRDGSIDLDPANYWTIRNANVKGVWIAGGMPGQKRDVLEEGEIRVHIAYELSEASGGLHLPKTRRFTCIPKRLGPAAAGAGLTAIESPTDWVTGYRLKVIPSDQVDESKFTLTAFGLPEPELPGRSRWAWFAAIGIGMLVAAMVLWRKLA